MLVVALVSPLLDAHCCSALTLVAAAAAAAPFLDARRLLCLDTYRCSALMLVKLCLDARRHCRFPLLDARQRPASMFVATAASPLLDAH